MKFIYRFGVSVFIAGVFPLFVVNYSLQAAYETHLLFTCAFVWMFMMPLSLYSSPTNTLQYDAAGNAIAVFEKEASYRAVIGSSIVLLSIAIYLAFLLFASYAFAVKYEYMLLGPIIALGPFGAYLYIVPMCPYCKKLNRPNLKKCESCNNELHPNIFQDKNA